MKEIKKSSILPNTKNSRVILTGNRKIFVETYDKVLKFEQDSILLLVGKRKLLIHGKNLWLESYDRFDLQIKGIITSIEYPEYNL